MNSNIKLAFICLTLLVIFIISVYSLITNTKKKKKKEIIIETVDESDVFISNSNWAKKMRENKIIKMFGTEYSPENTTKLQKLFYDSKNPWGITVAEFRAIRVIGTILGVLIAIVSVSLTNKIYYCVTGVMIAGLSIYYPGKYYRDIAKEREEEWDKIYEFIWLLKFGCWQYSPDRACIETMNYIKKYYPQYTELIQGFSDFNRYWNEDKIPEYIIKYYDFPIAKEIYNILYQIPKSKRLPDQSFENLRKFAYNKYSGNVQKMLSYVPAYATLCSLPFLMISIVVALLVPMLISFIRLM